IPGLATPLYGAYGVFIGSGIIGSSTGVDYDGDGDADADDNDVDYFYFDAGPDLIDIAIDVSPILFKPNLDVQLKVYATGNTSSPLATVNPADEIDASVSFQGSGGYYLEIDGVGKNEALDYFIETNGQGGVLSVGYSDYGSLGHYDLRVTVGDPLVTDAPRVANVVLGRSDAEFRYNPFSFDQIVAAGEQLKPIYRQDVDFLSIQFTEEVAFDQGGDELMLIGSGTNESAFELDSDDYSFSYNALSHTGYWLFDAPLPSDKYRIELDSLSITDSDGNALDGEWVHLPGEDLNSNLPTWDDFLDDGAAQFPSGTGVSGGDFVFKFALLAGDVDQNGLVNSDDVTAQASAPVDIDGDGDTDTDDSNLITSLAGTSLTVRAYGPVPGLAPHDNSGDFNDDEVVNGMDYLVWRTLYGESDVRADGNGDSAVNAADYTVWQMNLSDYSGWYEGPIPNAPPQPPIIWGVGPQVMNVTISGSQSTHDPFDFNTVDGSGDQLATVPVGGADTISITFSEDVNVAANHLHLVGLRTANRPVLADFDYDILSMTATWRFEGWALADHYAITLSDSVTDIEGIPLDGDWTNPSYIGQVNASISEFPSGDGEGGGDFVFVATLLPGDADLDGVVGIVDYGVLAGTYGQQVEQLFTDADFDGDGDVDSIDFGYLGATYGFDFTQPLALLGDLDDNGTSTMMMASC
ncbi:MAG: hypothetical protein KDA37_05530, partial [Planctomycetales bacterium]|nr:hypothetical protein [Planctomycetales bacterium]